MATSLPSHMAGFLHELGSSRSGVYSYVSYPAAILPNISGGNGSGLRARYRNEEPYFGLNHSGGFNLVGRGGRDGGKDPNDLRRIVRGNTYAQRVPFKVTRDGTVDGKADGHLRPLEGQVGGYRVQGRPRRGAARRDDLLGPSPTDGGSLAVSPGAGRTAARARSRRRLQQSSSPASGSFRTPVDWGMDSGIGNRRHCIVQTESWLEEIVGVHSGHERAVQTEGDPDDDPGVHADRRPSKVAALFFGEALGVDKSTQILPDDPELFVFDEEVIVILETLVGKTIEQSLEEVIEEEELAAIAQQKLSFRNKSLLMQNSC